MNTQEQVSRLEALLARVQRNATALSRERQLGVQVSAPLEDVVQAQPDSLPVAAPSLQDDAVSDSYAPDAPTLAPPSQLASATLAQPQFDDTHEETKPLWVGIQPPPPYPGQPAPSTVSEAPPAPISAAPISAAPAPMVEDDVRDTLEPLDSLPSLEPLEPFESLPHFNDALHSDALHSDALHSDAEADDIPEAIESSPPPLSGERTSARAPSEPPVIEVGSLEEVLESSPPLDPAFETSQPFISNTVSEAPFEEDRDSRISDAPASALGATINLPDEEAESLALELAEPPPSSMRLVTPAPEPHEEELEADLPRHSHRAAYDDTLSVPPEAREELAAHDQGVRETRSIAPALDAEPLPSKRSDVDSEIPAVLSGRPAVPSMIPDSVPPVSAPRVSTATEAGLTAEAPFAAQTTLEFTPPVGAPLPEFVGEFPKPQDLSFLALLDASLTLDLSH